MQRTKEDSLAISKSQTVNKHGCCYMVYLHERTRLIHFLTIRKGCPVEYPQGKVKTISLQAPQAMIPSRLKSAV
jgi:hypothetical protein